MDHVEVLRKLRESYRPFVTETTQALDAAIAALSAKPEGEAEVLDRLVEALECVADVQGWIRLPDGRTFGVRELYLQITSLMKAAEGEAVAWRIDYSNGTRIALFEVPADAMFKACGAKITPLYTHPPRSHGVVVDELIAADVEYDEAAGAATGFIEDGYEEDSYGVPGSAFDRCLACDAESGAGILNKGVSHELGCVRHRYEAAIQRRRAALVAALGEGE